MATALPLHLSLHLSAEESIAAVGKVEGEKYLKEKGVAFFRIAAVRSQVSVLE